MTVKTTRDMLKLHVFACIDKMDDKAFAGFANLVLIATGVTDGDGELTEEYRGESIEFTALELGVDPSEVREMIGRHELQAHMWTGSWIVTRDSIDALKAVRGCTG